jgi:hypothetical protein
VGIRAFFISIVIISVVLILKNLTTEYNIYSMGLMIPAKEWVLTRSSDGNFVTSFKDNIKGVP